MGNYVSDSTGGDTDNEKRKLTPQLIYDTLASQNKSELVGGVLAGAVLLVVALLFVLIFSAGGFFTEKGLVIANMAVLSVPFLVFLLFVFLYWKGMKRLFEGNYVVITDTVERVVTDDKLVRRYNGHRYTTYMEHAMYLYRCGRIVISLEETYVNSENDVYYIVLPHKDSNHPLLRYNSKFYELEDLEVE